MENVLLAVDTEDHTFSETILGIFPDTEQGLAAAIVAASAAVDYPHVYRVKFGQAIDDREEIKW